MQIANEKPQIDLVLEAHIGASRQEIEQKDRNTDSLKIYDCFKEFETANPEIRNPEEMRFSTSSNTSSLSDSIYKVEESGLNFLQTAENESLDYNLQLTETYLPVFTAWKTVSSSRRLAWTAGIRA